MSVSKASLERAPHGFIMIIAMVLVCLNLSVAFGGVGPLVPYMHLSVATVSALTAAPPLCMGIFAPLGPFLRRRFGLSRALFLSMLILALGNLARCSIIAGLLIGTEIASVVQTIGYGVAASGTLVLAFLHYWSGGWGWPIAALLSLLVINACISPLGGRGYVVID